MNKKQITTKVLDLTHDKLKTLSKQSGLSIGQLIDYMTKKQKLVTLK
jgi:hypothetical protein